MAVAPATRRAHSHRPGLCSDKWGASCPDAWSRGRRASPRQRGSCLGRRRSDGGPGPTKPVQLLSPPRRGASPRACTYPPPPRNPPPTKPSRQRPRSDPSTPAHPHSRHWHPPNVIPAKAGIHREGRRPSPQWPSPATPDEERRPPCPQVDADPALLEVMQRAPTGSNPPPRLSAEDTPWANRPSKGPRPQSIKGESSNSLGKGALARKQLLFYPPASFKRPTKNTKQSYKGRLIIRHFCSPRRPSSPTT